MTIEAMEDDQEIKKIQEKISDDIQGKLDDDAKKRLNSISRHDSFCEEADGKRNKSLEKLLREARYEIISFVCSFGNGNFTDYDDDIVNNMMHKLGCGKRLETGSQVLLYVLKKLKKLDITNRMQLTLKFRFISDYLTANDEVKSKKLLRKILKNISPGFFFPWSKSKVSFRPDAFDQSNIINTLRLATENEVAYSEIKNAFRRIRFEMEDCKPLELFAYARWINIDWARLWNINHFTVDQSMLVHRNVALCKEVIFERCKVPLLTTNANESTTTLIGERQNIQLEVLRMYYMRIDESELSSAANLFGLAEWVGLYEIQVGAKEFESIMETLIQMKQRRLKKIVLQYCQLVNPALMTRMERNGVKIDEIAPTGRFIVISNAPGNQIEANQIKQKFADEIGCPVLVKVQLEKYQPKVIIVLLTDKYEKSKQCGELINYPWSWRDPKIIAVKLNNDFQPGDELNKIVRESICICWTDKTNFDTNFAKVKEEINAYFAKAYTILAQAGIPHASRVRKLPKIRILSTYNTGMERLADNRHHKSKY
eukprot:gene6524-biopygen5313